MRIESGRKLSELTTFQIGGKADYFVAAASEAELGEALKFASDKKLPILILGRGSNTLASDEGFRGLVIQNRISGLEISSEGLVTVGGGEDWGSVVDACIAKNLAGVECLSGIPGSSGGSVVQNIGAYGQTLGDVVTKVWAIEAYRGRERIFTPQECEFAYRSSYFKKNLNQYIVTKFEMQLIPNGRPNVTYADLSRRFAGHQPTLAQVRDAVIEIRAAKGYLIMSGFESYNTAGSFFKNPVVSAEQFQKLQPMFGDESTNRYWPTNGKVKLAAAFLMQEAGFGKGFRDGRVGISPKHSLSLVNFGGATAVEVKALAVKIKQAVAEKFGVQLEEEILYV